MIFFDLDGTLLDSNGVWLDIDIAFLGALGVDPVPPEYTQFVTYNSFNASAHYTRELYAPHMSVEQIVRTWQDMAQEHYAHRLPLKPGARTLLETLKARGERIGLLTSCMPHLATSALERHCLLTLFDTLCFSHLLGIEKSDPGLYGIVAKEQNLACGQCTLFDDSPDYLSAAKQAGWQVWGVRDSLFDHRSHEFLTLCGPDRYLDSLLSHPALQA
jgi:HAD superfamily hydrolase (TIGR01509 family)